jgi:hypothetical protein
MHHSWLPLLALAAAAPAGALELAHQPVTCTAPERYVRVVARGVPAEGVAAGAVGFRAGPQSDWYTVAMVSSGGEWAAFIPRPTSALARFEYRVALTGTDAATVTTPPIGVSVGPDCPDVESMAVATAIVVQVPAGAPAVPPVPPGFSPVGATALQPAARAAGKGGLSGGKVLLGAGVLAAAGAGAALAVRDGEPAPLDVPGFRFDRTMPLPGATISEPRGDRLAVVITMSREPDRPLSVEWGVELLASAAGPRCGVLAGTFAPAQRPLGLVLSSRVINGGPCGPVFDVAVLRVIAIVDGVTVLQQDVAAPFHFEIGF